MKKVIFTLGLPASGKSTFIEKYLRTEFTIVDPDLFSGTYEERGKEVARHIEKLGNAGADFCIMSASGSEWFRETLEWFIAREYEITVLYFNLSKQKAKELNSKRTRIVPEYVYDNADVFMLNNVEIAKEIANYFYEIIPNIH